MPKNIDELPEGGMGIKMMSDLADELSYTRTPTQQNCLLIVKKYEQQEPAQSHNIQNDNLLKQFINSFSHLNWIPGKYQGKQQRQTPLQNIFLQVNTDLTAVNQVLDWYEQLENLPIPRTIFWQCKLAIVEGFTNAVRHAHKDLPLETPIELEVTVFNESVEIKIYDYGQPFDLEAKLRELDKNYSQKEGKLWIHANLPLLTTREELNR